MAQLEPHKDELQQVGVSLAYIAAEKRTGFFNPERLLRDYPISFPFLLDEDRAVTKAYGVYHRIGMDAFNIAHPATFVVAHDGTIKFMYIGSSQTDRIPWQAVIEVLKR